jgi:phospholipid-binding lipoprotein MlaA
MLQGNRRDHQGEEARIMPILRIGILVFVWLLLPTYAYADVASDTSLVASSLVEEDPRGPAAVSLDADPLFDDFDDDFDLDFGDEGMQEISDPLEPVNRGILTFNRGLDRLIMDPITVVYRFVTPTVVRRSVERFFANINSTQSLVNDLMQLEWRDAGITTGRLVVNSTVGVAGLFDPASSIGLQKHVSDFGQTLTLAGASSGPYFVLPLFGPSNLRDAVGMGVDSLFHPTFFILPGADALFFNGGSGLSRRAQHYDELKALEEGSIDYYAALRSGFMQNRRSEIWSRREHRRGSPLEARD